MSRRPHCHWRTRKRVAAALDATRWTTVQGCDSAVENLLSRQRARERTGRWRKANQRRRFDEMDEKALLETRDALMYGVDALAELAEVTEDVKILERKRVGAKGQR